MTVPHLVISGANDFLAKGSGESLLIFETRVEDAMGHVATGERAALIEDIRLMMQDMDRADGRLDVLLDFLHRQRRVIRGEL